MKIKFTITDEFNIALDNICKYIDFFLENKKLCTNLSELIDESIQAGIKNEARDLGRKYGDLKKEIYKGVVINIYSVFERFIRCIAIEYVEKIKNYSPQFKDLPDLIKKEMIVHSLGAIKSFNKYRLDSESVKVVEQNFYDCLNSKEEYSLNAEIMFTSYQSMNMLCISDLFNKIGILDIKNQIQNNKVFQNDYMVYKNATSIINTENVFKKVDDFVRRRHIVAHGGFEDNYIDIDILRKDFLEVIRLMCNSIDRILILQVMGFAKNAMRLNNLVINENIASNTITVDNIGSKLSKGDFVYVVDKNGNDRIVIVEDIQINHISKDNVENIANVAISFDGKIKKQSLLFYA